MGLGSEFSKKASAHLHCIEVLREDLYGKLGKDVHRVFCPSKAGWQIGSPFRKDPNRINRRQASLLGMSSAESKWGEGGKRVIEQEGG